MIESLSSADTLHKLRFHY